MEEKKMEVARTCGPGRGELDSLHSSFLKAAIASLQKWETGGEERRRAEWLSP